MSPMKGSYMSAGIASATGSKRKQCWPSEDRDTEELYHLAALISTDSPAPVSRAVANASSNASMILNDSSVSELSASCDVSSIQDTPVRKLEISDGVPDVESKSPIFLKKSKRARQTNEASFSSDNTSVNEGSMIDSFDDEKNVQNVAFREDEEDISSVNAVEGRRRRSNSVFASKSEDHDGSFVSTATSNASSLSLDTSAIGSPVKSFKSGVLTRSRVSGASKYIL